MSEITLKEYTDHQVAAVEKLLTARLTSLEREIKLASKLARRAVDNSERLTERALDKAAAAVEIRLEGMNEFRDQLTAQAADFLTRKESDVWRSSLEDKLRSTERRLDKTEGRGGGMRDYFAWIVAGVALLGMLLALADRWAG